MKNCKLTRNLYIKHNGYNRKHLAKKGKKIVMDVNICLFGFFYLTIKIHDEPGTNHDYAFQSY